MGLNLTHESKYDACIEGFRLTYVEPLFDYIDEQIDDKRMTLVLLKSSATDASGFIALKCSSGSRMTRARARASWRLGFTNTYTTKECSFTLNRNQHQVGLT